MGSGRNMKRANYYNYIEEKLHTLATRITTGGKLNMLSLHLHSESFYQHFFNLLYDYKLKNLNQYSQNVEAIDLIDETKKVIIQVSSRVEKTKIESALSKNIIREYSEDDYTFKFISIAKDASELRKKEYKNPHSIKFEPISDIYDITSLLSQVYSLDIDKLEGVYTFIKKELGDTFNRVVNRSLTYKVATDDSFFVGRELELKYIDEQLDSSDSLLLLNGIGGMGKSSLANYYLYTREDKFDYVGFIDELDSFVSEFRHSLDLKYEKENELFNEIIYKLRQLKGKKLLVVDNIEDIEKNKKLIEMILSLKKDDYKILFTSRRKIKNVKNYSVGTLLFKDARRLFLSYFKTEELEKVDKVIKYFGSHTLFIKLVAETMKKEGYSLDDIIEKFESEDGGLTKIAFIDEESGNEVTFNKNLQVLFSMQNLNNENVLLLKRLAILPSIDIKLSFLEEILNKEELVQGRLDFLFRHGWLIKNDKSYKLHQVIKEFILVNHPPYLEEVEYIIDFFNIMMMGSTNIDVSLEIQRYLLFYSSIINVIDRLEFKSINIGSLFINLSNIYCSLGEYNIALTLCQKSIEQREIVLGIESLATATSYNNMGRIYNLIGVYNKAFSYYTKTLTIREKLLEKNHPDMAGIYNSFATHFESIGKPHKALSFYEKSLEIHKKCFKANHQYIAISYNSIAGIYNSFGQNEKALEFYGKSLKLYLKNYGAKHIEMTKLYNNLGLCYKSLRDYDKALSLFELQIEILEFTFEGNHPDIAIGYSNLSTIYRLKKDYKLAFLTSEKSIDIYINTIGMNHVNTAVAFDNLASIYADTNKHVSAIEFYQKSLKIREKFLDSNHSDIIASYISISVSYSLLFDYIQAYSYMTKAVISLERTSFPNEGLLIRSKKALHQFKKKLKQKVNRNDSCPCKSGKKYKRCCGNNK